MRLLMARSSLRKSRTAASASASDQKPHGHEQGGRIAGLLKLEGGFVAVDRQQLGCFAGAAAGQHENLVEGAEGIDGSEYDGDGQNRAQHRQGKVGEHAPGAGAVDARRLERLGQAAIATRRAESGT